MGIKIIKYAAAPAIAALGIGLAAGCSTGSATKAAPPAHSSAPPAASTAPSHSANSSTSGPVGTTYKITDTEAGNSGNQTTVYTVKATQVIDPAAPDNSFDAAPTGQHLVAVGFVINGVSGNEQDDANINASVQGSNGQVYQPTLGGVAAGTDFNSGDFNTSPGSTVTGWVGFAIPDGVTITHVQWAARGGTFISPVTWQVSP